jgi:AbrB family looped-hinge helix DNA binding protein
MPSTATVSDKGQVTLPKALRDKLGIRPGARLEFVVGDDGVLRVKVLAEGSAGLAGLLVRPGEAPRSASELDAAITEAVRARASGRA